MISLLVPTRGRPKEFHRFAESAFRMADSPNEVEIIAYRDEDDTSEYGMWDNVKYISGPRIVLSEMWNDCWKAATGPYYGHMGDDIVFKSQGWDTRVKETIDKYPGKIAFVWGDDMAPTGRQTIFGTHGFVHKNWTDVTGRFVPPYFVSDYNDTWFNDVADMLEVGEYMPDVKTDHRHFVWGKGPQDRTHQERLQRHEREDPEALYFSPEMEWERHDEAHNLRMAIDKARGTDVKLTICIATLFERKPVFAQLVERTLCPQVKKYNGQIEILAYFNNGERPLAEIRQALVDEARGEYVCFLDDDDSVPGYYCEKIMEAIEEKPDYVGWRMQAYVDGKKLKPTYHSIRHKGWHDNKKGYFRSVSHLNPVRRELARKETFKHIKDTPEDVRWARAMQKHLETEVYIDEIMYYYRCDNKFSRWAGNIRYNAQGKRSAIKCASFRWHPECPMAFKFDINRVKLGYTGPGPPP